MILETEILLFEWIATIQWKEMSPSWGNPINIIITTELTAERKHCQPRDNHFFVQMFSAEMLFALTKISKNAAHKFSDEK